MTYCDGTNHAWNYEGEPDAGMLCQCGAKPFGQRGQVSSSAQCSRCQMPWDSIGHWFSNGSWVCERALRPSRGS